MKLKEKENRILFGLKQFGINEADGWKRFYLNGDAFEKILKNILTGNLNNSFLMSLFGSILMVVIRFR